MKKQKATWTPTGWYWDPKKEKWIPPDYTNESDKNWRWDDKKQTWIHTNEDERLERYRQFRAGKEPTYEEWKAAKLAGDTASKENKD